MFARHPPGIEVTQSVRATQKFKSTNASLLRLWNSHDRGLGGTDVGFGGEARFEVPLIHAVMDQVADFSNLVDTYGIIFADGANSASQSLG